MIQTNDTNLLVVDMQDRIMNSINSRDELIINTTKLIKSFSVLSINIDLTEQNPNKLGKTNKLISEIYFNERISKMSFSAIQEGKLLQSYQKNNIKNIVLCGIEAHICILQTALDLKSEGFNVLVPIDAIGSRNELDKDAAIKRMQGNQVSICSTEMIIFELCKTAERAEFREISSIIKGC